MEDVDKVVVIDNGSYQLKAGLCGSDLPSLITNVSNQEFIKHGVVTNFNNIQLEWSNILNHEQFNTTNTSISSALFLEVPLNPTANREKTTEIAFESLNLQQFYLLNTASAACYSLGRTTAIVVDSGYDQTFFNIIFEGYLMPHLCTTFPIGGHQITQQLAQKLENSKLCINDINEIKEKYSWVSFDYEQESKLHKNMPAIFKHCMDKFESEKLFKNLPNDVYNLCSKYYGIQSFKYSSFNLDHSMLRCCFECTELLFSSDDCNRYPKCLKELVLNRSFQRDSCWISEGKYLLEGVVVCGGNSLLQGFDDRLIKEIGNNIYPHWKCNICKPRKTAKQYLPWIGGSVVSSLSTFEEMWITKHMYDEYGPNIVHRRCY